VRGADTSHRDLTAESPGLYAMATGFQATSKDDFENMARQFPAYDALYASCRQHEPARSSGPRGFTGAVTYHARMSPAWTVT